MINNSWFKKENPLTTLIGMGGGATSLSAGGGMAPQIEASGGFVHDDANPDGNVYRCHIFTCPGTFVISDLGSSDGTIEYMLIAGGGAGSQGQGSGGGGAGGVQTNLPGVTAHPNCTTPALTLAAGTYPVTIGNGAAGTGDGAWKSRDGHNSVFGFPSTITADGGGGAGGRSDPGATPNFPNNNPWTGKIGCPGGSSGGGSWNPDGAPGPGNASPATQGYTGGSLGPDDGKYYATGGGGAGGAGGVPATDTSGEPQPVYKLVCGGDGGLGARVSSLPSPGNVGEGLNQIGTPGPASGRWFAGGGAGGFAGPPTYAWPGSNPDLPTSLVPTPNLRQGGSGGGGHGAGSVANEVGMLTNYGLLGEWNGPVIGGSQPGRSNGGQRGKHASGSGGGGGGWDYGGGGGDGAPGIGFVRYIISPAQTATAKATGGLVSFTPTHTIHTYINTSIESTFTTPASFNETIEWFVVGGGGGGGFGYDHRALGGGGGAGGAHTGTTPLNGAAALDIIVGLGGRGGGGGGSPKRWFNSNPDFKAYLTTDVWSRNTLGTAPGQSSRLIFPNSGYAGSPLQGATRYGYGGGGGGQGGTVPTSPTGPQRYPDVYNMNIANAHGGCGGCGGGNSNGFPGGPWPEYPLPGGQGQRVPGRENTPAQDGGGPGNGPAGTLGYDGGTADGGEDNASRVAAGGGGLGGAGQDAPWPTPGPNAPTASIAGNGGIGVQLPTTFRSPLTLMQPGPGGNWYVGGGGCGGYRTPQFGPDHSQPAPNPQPYGGGGAAQLQGWESKHMGVPYCDDAAFGKQGTGSGGGGGAWNYNPGGGNPYTHTRYNQGGPGGSGVVMIAYPT